MRIIHTADWHLGDTFHGFDRQDEHLHFFNWLENMLTEQQPDALLVSGDIFDSPNPSAAAERMLYDFLCRITQQNEGLQIILIAGNHDSSYRLEAPASLLGRLGIEVRGAIGHNDKGAPDYDHLLIPLQGRTNPDDKAVVMALPYLRSDDYREGETIQQGTKRTIQELHQRALNLYGKDIPYLLMAHFYAVGSEINADEHSERLVVGGQECIACTDLGKSIAYTALGHIHKAQRIGGQDNVRYAGSALPMSFSEKNYKHGANLVSIDSGRVSIQRLDYSPLRSLLSIPEEGCAGFEEVMHLLEKLPTAHRAEQESWPYLEVQVEELCPNPTMANAIAKVVSERKVRLCRIVRVRPGGQPGGDTAPIATTDDLRKLNPALLAKTIYKNVYGEEMPDEIGRLFAQAKRQAEAE